MVRGRGQNLSVDATGVVDGWRLVSLKDVVELVRGVSWNKSEENRSGMPVVTIPFVRNGTVDFEVKYRLAKTIPPEKVLREGDILLVGSSGSVHNVGRSAVVGVPPRDTTFASFLIRALPKNADVDREFLGFLLESPIIDFTSVSKRAADGKFNLQVQELRDYKVALPSLTEQKAIVSILRAVKRDKQATERVINTTVELRRSLIQYLFSYGPVPIGSSGDVSRKETEVGAVPSDWEVVQLQDVIAEGPQNGIYKPAADYGQGHMIVRIDDFHVIGEILARAPNRVRLSSSELERYSLRTNDLLFNRVNSLPQLGKIALVGKTEDSMVFESNMMRFAVDPHRILPEFALRWLSAPVVRSAIQGRAKRAVAQSSVNQGDLRTIPCPLPPLTTQEAIVTILRGIDQKIKAERSRLLALKAASTSALSELMSGGRRVTSEAA